MARVAWLTPKQYADRVGKTARVINKNIEHGKITKKSLKKIGKRFLINPEAADQDRADNISYVNKKQDNPPKKEQKKEPKKNPTQAEIKSTTQAAGTKGMSLADAQKLQAQYKAALLKLEYEQKSGKLIQVIDVEKDAFEIARIVRDVILNIPDRISAELASITDVHIVSEKLTTELTAALEELSK